MTTSPTLRLPSPSLHTREAVEGQPTPTRKQGAARTDPEAGSHLSQPDAVGARGTLSRSGTILLGREHRRSVVSWS